MPLQVIDPASFPAWDDVLLSSPGYSFFHSSAWARVLKDAYGYTPMYFTIIENNSFAALVPVMEVNSYLTGRRGVSLPFTDFCEPILKEESAFSDLFKNIIAYGKKRRWKYIELRGGQKYLRPQSPVLSPVISSLSPESSVLSPFSSFLGHAIDLSPGPESLYSNLRDSTRRNIKKAQKEGVDAVISTSTGALRDFYRLNTITRKDHGLPPQPYCFFQSLHEHILSQELGFIILAYKNKAAVAANVYLRLGDQLVYKYGASDKAFQHLRANNLVMWEAVKWGCAKGCKSLCFGRTETENEGLRQFKTGWGAREYRIAYYRYDLSREAFIKDHGSINPFYNKIFSKIPVSVLKPLGNLLYRHMG